MQPDASFLTEEGKDFVVIQQEGKSAQELYNQVLQAVTLQYNSAKDVISKVENSVISVNGIANNVSILSAMFGVKVFFSIQYVIQFQFKDGRIRVDAPRIARLFTDSSADISPIEGWLNAQKIFKNGERNKEEVIAGFENTLNRILEELLYAKNNEEDW